MNSKAPPSKNDGMIMLSIPRTLRERIKELAKEDGRSMRSYLDRVIKEKEEKR